MEVIRPDPITEFLLRRGSHGSKRIEIKRREIVQNVLLRESLDAVREAKAGRQVAS